MDFQKRSEKKETIFCTLFPGTILIVLNVLTLLVSQPYEEISSSSPHEDIDTQGPRQPTTATQLGSGRAGV